MFTLSEEKKEGGTTMLNSVNTNFLEGLHTVSFNLQGHNYVFN